MKLSQVLIKKIESITNITLFNSAILNICDEYLTVHPKPTPFWSSNGCMPNVFNTHRSQEAAVKIKERVKNFSTPDSDEKLYDYVMSLTQSMSSGDLSKAISKCQETLINTSPKLKEVEIRYDNEFIMEFIDLTPFG